MRHVAALGLLAVMAASSGCFGILGPGEPDPDALGANATYDIGTDKDALIQLNRDNYTAVYDVSSKTTGTDAEGDDPGTFEVYRRDALGTERPRTLEALQFWFDNGSHVEYRNGTAVRVGPNGTVTNASSLAVSRTRRRTIVDLPAAEGHLAYTTSKTGKTVRMPTFVEGSYEVVLPPDTSVAIPLIARVRPGGYSTDSVEGRVHITWEPLEGGSLIVRYYLHRDIRIFGVIAVLLTIIGIAGLVYYLIQIRALIHRREEVGLDVDVGDDDSRRPPPGMG